MTRGAGFDVDTHRSLVAARVGGVAASVDQTRMASVVSFGRAGTYQVGQASDDENSLVVRYIRRHLGTDWTVTAHGRTFTAQEVAARLLHRLKVEAESALSDRITHHVLSVPASFVESQRQAIKEAAQIAGCEDVTLLNESSAAALSFGASGDEGHPLVVCLSQGYLSVAVAEQGDGVIEIKATSGEDNLADTAPSPAPRQMTLSADALRLVEVVERVIRGGT